MKVDLKKIQLYRKQKKISLDELCNEIDISRTTIWKWKKNKSFPKETHIRSIAKMLDIPVDKISDLQTEHPVSDTDISNAAASWVELSDHSSPSSSNHFDQLNKILSQLKLKLDNASLIIRGLMNAIPSEVYIKDKNRKYVIANSKFKNTFSLSKNFNFLGKKDTDFFSKKEAELNEAEDTKVLVSGKPILNREGFMPGSRKKKWAMISKLPIFDTKNNIEGIIAVFFDITERKHNEELREQLEINLNNMSEGIVIYNEDTMDYLYVNKASAEMHGYTLEEYSKMHKSDRINNYIFPDDREKLSQFLEHKVWNDIFRYRIIRPNGDIRWIEAHHTKSKFMSNNCIISVQLDITERKYNEELREQLEINLSNMSEGIVIYDENTMDHLYTNRASAEMHGYSLDEFYNMQKSTRREKYVHPEDINIVEEYLKGNNWNDILRYRIIRPNGEVRWLETHHSQSYFMSRNCIVSVQLDITESYKKTELREIFEKSINLTGNALIIFNTDTRKIVYANKAVKDVYGYEASILLNKSISFFISNCINSESKLKILSSFKQNNPSLNSINCITSDGKIKNLECQLFKQRYSGQECLVFNSKATA